MGMKSINARNNAIVSAKYTDSITNFKEPVMVELYVRYGRAFRQLTN